MSKKKNNKILIFVFVILLAAVGANQLIRSSKGERSFRKDIIEMQADEINKISIFPKNAGNRYVEIALKDSVWQLKFDNILFAADQDLIKGIVDELATMTPERLVANQKELWKDYDITDSLGVKVVVYSSKGKKSELTLGRFTYNQDTRKPITYLRVDSDKGVYAVEGYLAMTFNREINSLRDRNLFRGNQNDLTQISFTYPADSSFTLTKEGTGWLLNGAPVDSSRMASYLNTVSYLVGSDFRDDFNPATAPQELCKLQITRQNMNPVEIKAYQDAKGIVLNSSENKLSYFSGGKPDIFNMVFQGKGFFFGANKPK